MTDYSKLKGLAERATPGPWVSVRVEPTTASSGVFEPYSPWCTPGPRLVTVGRSVLLHADDAAFIDAALTKEPEHE